MGLRGNSTLLRKREAIVAAAALSMMMIMAGAAALGDSVWYHSSLDYSANAANIALGKPTTQSSFYGGGVDHSAAAVDGGLSHQEGCIRTADESSAWWTVDLGADVSVAYVKLFNFVNLEAWWEENLGYNTGGFTILMATSSAPSAFQATQGYTMEGDVSSTRKMFGAVNIFPVHATGRYLRIAKNGWGSLRMCELQAFTVEPDMAYVVPQAVTEAAEAGVEVECPPAGHPLHDGCVANSGAGGAYQGNAAMALVKTAMQGPIGCGGKGFFCRMKMDSYFSGTPQDQLYNNKNFGYCADGTVDNPDNIFPGNFGEGAARNDGHCHGSHLDSVYEAVLKDHYNRIYRGDLECCCGETVTEHSGDYGLPTQQNGWKPATNLVSRCDFRGADGNNGGYDFNGGCGGDSAGGAYRDPSLFVDSDTYKATHMCWDLKHFGRQPVFYNGPNPLQLTTATPLADPPYPKPFVSIEHCTGDAANWEGCLLYVEGRSTVKIVVLVSTSYTAQPRTVASLDVWNDKPSSCHHVDGIQVGSENFRFYPFSDLDTDGQEVGYVRLAHNFEAGSEVHIQVFDTETCMVSDLKSSVIGGADSPSSNTGGNRRLLM